jgi:hypothetical protein
VILLLYLLGPLAVTLVAAVLTRSVLDAERRAPEPAGAVFLGFEAFLTVAVFGLVHWRVNLPDEERCRSDSGVSGVLSFVLVLGTAAVGGISLASFVGDARRFGPTFSRVVAIAVAAVLPYVAYAAVIYGALTCLS